LRHPLSIIRSLAAYHLRTATIDDADALVHHRIAMFQDMDIPFDPPVLDRAFRPWLLDRMRDGTYHAWVVEDPSGVIVAGAGATVVPWPPGPQYLNERIAIVYNVYTEPAHRRRGLARLLMDTIHGWCRASGITSVALNASRDGRHLYESMGYQLPASPMMFLSIAGYNPSALAEEGRPIRSD
jgi:GNAT superfamily N-acetyltransferase